MAAFAGLAGGAVSASIAIPIANAAAEGLVPPGAAATVAVGGISASPGLWPRERQLGLKPDKYTRFAGDASANPGPGLVFYSTTRVDGAPGWAQARSYSGVRYPLSIGWSSAVEASVQPLQSATRGYTLAGRLDRTLAGGRGLSLGLRYSVHEQDAPGMLPVGAVPAYPAVPELRHPFATVSSSGYEVKLSYRYGERNSVGLSYGSATELDNARAWLDGYAAEGRLYGLTGRHWITPDWALSYGLVANGPGARSQGLRLGLRYSF